MNPYARKHVLVTGGLGFIGSNLAIRLVQLGAHVTIVDLRVRDCGSNLQNIRPIANDVAVVEADIGDPERIRPLLKGLDIIFNAAGEVSHSHSMEFPERDLELNTRSQLTFLNLCARELPGVRIVYTCTRQIYGKPQYLPVDELHPVVPVDFNGVHKYAAGSYHLLLSRMGQLDAVVLRLTNTYGPRLALNVPCQGVLSTFFLRILLGLPIEIYGDGLQVRDPLYVDDAVDALLTAGVAEQLPSRTYNVGGHSPLSLADIVGILCRSTGAPLPSYRPFPPERAIIDIGSFVTDSSRILRDMGWRSVTTFEEGADRTLSYFRAHLGDYIDPSDSLPQCALRPSLLRTPVSA